MDLELGLKITKTREDVSSSVDFRFSKDPFGPLVLSRETDSRFIIIIHLKGFKKEGIEIEINKEGDRITIKGRKPVEEMVMIIWMTWKKEVEFRVFKKVFKIPDTVDLDKIKARFDEDDATLTITMPKRVKGISGFNIEEGEEEEERVDFGDVSEAEHKEETEKGDVAEESTEREESDVHSEKLETEIQKEEEFGEKDSQVLGEEQEDEDETEDDYLEKSHKSDEQDKTMERIEEDKELADSNKESENSSLRKPGDIEGRDSHEQTIHDEQENNKQMVQA